jgi:hypothetical protein
MHMPFSVARALRGGLIALCLVAALPAAAQQAQPAPSPGQVQLARELIESNGSLKALDAIVPAYLEQARNMFAQNNPDLVGPLTEVAAGLRAEFDAKRGEVIDGIARAYAARFTEAELKELVAFYKSTTGKKFVATLPVVLQESFERMQAWSAKLSEEMIGRIRAEMRKKGHEL